jgi:hypothetical protein
VLIEKCLEIFLKFGNVATARFQDVEDFFVLRQRQQDVLETHELVTMFFGEVRCHIQVLF